MVSHEMSPQEIRVLLDHGVTGDAVHAMLAEARGAVDDNPASVYSYALWRALLELDRYFEDDQGIPAAEWHRVNIATKAPLERLLELGGLNGENPAASRELLKLLKGLHALRLTQSEGPLR